MSTDDGRGGWVGALAAVGLAVELDLPPTGWASRLATVEAAGLTGLLLVAHAGGSVTLDDDEVGELEQLHGAALALSVRLEAALVALLPALERAGGVVLKGPVLAHDAYPDATLRPFTDLDLLVPGASLAGMGRELRRLGYAPSWPEPSRGYVATVAKAVAFLHPSGLLVDLHRAVAPGGSAATVDVDELLAGRRHVRVGDVDVPALGLEAALVATALHAVDGDGLGRARSLRDVVQLALDPRLDAGAAAALARRWGVEDVLATALAGTRERLRVEPPPALAELTTRAAAVRVETAAELTVRRRVAELRGAGARRRGALLRSWFAPRQAFLRARYGEGALPLLYWRRWRELGATAVRAWRKR